MLLEASVWVPLLLGLIALGFAQWVKKRRALMRTFKELNIPGPEPHFLFGNMREFIKKNPDVCLREWSNKYGKIFGYFFGASPIIVVRDAELLRNIQIKDFQNFMNRPSLIPGGLQPEKLFNLHILRQRDQKWKNMRAILTPSFTSGKMKQMVPIINEAIEEFLGHVGDHSKSDKDFDIYAMYKALTLDVIGRTAFGIKTEVQKDPQNDDFVLAVQDALREDDLSGLVALSVCLPELVLFFVPLRRLLRFLKGLLGRSRLQELASNCQAILRSRRENPQNQRRDLMQLMLDAQLSHTDLKNVSTDSLTVDYDSKAGNKELASERATDGKRVHKSNYSMNDDEILSNIFVVLFAGFDTTSTTLGFSSHILVNRQDIQDKIREEVTNVYRKDGFLDFTNVSRCQYLEQFLSESLRFYPPVRAFARECAEEIKYENLTIPKKYTIQIPLDIHRDPDYWTDPDSFIPERFAPENKKSIHPMAFQTFGGGPRNCIGMRFAQMEAKMALAQILLNFKLVPGPRTQLGEVDKVCKVLIMNPKNVFLKAEKIDIQL